MTFDDIDSNDSRSDLQNELNSDFMNDKLEPSNQLVLSSTFNTPLKNKIETCDECKTQRSFFNTLSSERKMYDKDGRRYIGSNRFFKFAI